MNIELIVVLPDRAINIGDLYTLKFFRKTTS
jgi:hypothetical protein